MATLTDCYICETCRSPLIASESGSVCPNGHGFIKDKLPPDIKRRNHAIVALGLRDLQKLPGGLFVFELGGQRYEQVPKTKAITRVLNEWPSEVPEGETLGIIDGTKIIRLQPCSR